MRPGEKGTLTSAPAVAAWGPNRLDVFVRGTDQALHHAWTNDGGRKWLGWERLGGEVTSGPAVAAWGPGRLDVFARGTDYSLYHAWFDGRWWPVPLTDWEPQGRVLTSAPGVASQAPGRLDIIVSGTDGALHRKSCDASGCNSFSSLSLLP